MDINPRFKYPPPIARTLGFDLVESGERTATIEIVTDLAKHANPMGRCTEVFYATSPTQPLEQLTPRD